MNTSCHISTHISPKLGQSSKNIYLTLAMASVSIYIFQILPNLSTSLHRNMAWCVHDV